MPSPSSDDLQTWSFSTLLIGGILILVSGLMGTLMMGAWGTSGMGAMMDAYMGANWSTATTGWMAGLGLATGGLVLASAYNVYHAHRAPTWGVIAIVAGALSLLAMGGFVLGAVAAIAGGALALVDTRRSPRKEVA